MNDRSVLLLVVLVYLPGVLLCVFSPNGPYLVSFSTLYTSLFESWLQRTDSTHWFSFFFILLLQFFSLSRNKENTFSGGPLIQPEAFPRDVRIERLGCLSTDLIFGLLSRGRSPAQFCHSWRGWTAFVLLSYAATAPWSPPSFSWSFVLDESFSTPMFVAHWVTLKKEDRKRRLGELWLLSGAQVEKACT